MGADFTWRLIQSVGLVTIIGSKVQQRQSGSNVFWSFAASLRWSRWIFYGRHNVWHAWWCSVPPVCRLRRWQFCGRDSDFPSTLQRVHAPDLLSVTTNGAESPYHGHLNADFNAPHPVTFTFLSRLCSVNMFAINLHYHRSLPPVWWDLYICGF